MAKDKADELDRNRIISELERHYSVKLEKVKPHKKWLKDETGKNWWVLVGEEDAWHEIPQACLKAERNAQTEGMIVVAEKKGAIMDAFAAPTSQVVTTSELKTGDFQFNCKKQRGCLKIKEIPSMALKPIFSIDYSDEQKNRDKRINEFKKICAAASSEERREIVRMLGAQSDGL